MIATDKDWKNKYKGKECLILGGGHREKIDHAHNIINPYEYQRCEELDKYKHTVFGCNSAFKVRHCDFIVIKDPWVYEDFKEEYRKLDSIIFYVGTGEESSDYISVKRSELPRVGTSFEDGIQPYLSGYCALHLALLMGFSKIYLSGFLGGNTCIGSLSANFIFFSEWKDYRKKIFVTDENSILNDFFKYKRLPLDK